MDRDGTWPGPRRAAQVESVRRPAAATGVANTAVRTPARRAGRELAPRDDAGQAQLARIGTASSSRPFTAAVPKRHRTAVDEVVGPGNQVGVLRRHTRSRNRPVEHRAGEIRVGQIAIAPAAVGVLTTGQPVETLDQKLRQLALNHLLAGSLRLGRFTLLQQIPDVAIVGDDQGATAAAVPSGELDIVRSSVRRPSVRPAARRQPFAAERTAPRSTSRFMERTHPGLRWSSAGENPAEPRMALVSLAGKRRVS